jgi:hypothetical protein
MQKKLQNFLIAAGIVLVFLILFNPNQYNREKFTWIEEKHGNQEYEKYPPCFDICEASRNIFDLLQSRNLHVKYSKILNVHSIMLCHEKMLQRLCNGEINVKLDQRIKALKELGGQESNLIKTIIQTYGFKYNPQKQKTFTMLVMSMDVIEKQFEFLKYDLSSSDFEKIKEFNNIFYRVHYNIIYNMCDNNY